MSAVTDLARNPSLRFSNEPHDAERGDALAAADSPTTPKVSPGFTSKLTPSTACTTPRSVMNVVVNRFTRNSGSDNPLLGNVDRLDGGDVWLSTLAIVAAKSSTQLTPLSVILYQFKSQVKDFYSLFK